jgi:hypothetical protein
MINTQDSKIKSDDQPAADQLRAVGAVTDEEVGDEDFQQECREGQVKLVRGEKPR